MSLEFPRSKISDGKMYLGWKELAHLYPSTISQFKPIDEVFKAYWGLSGESYGSKFNPIFLSHVFNLSDLKIKPFWLSRDGFVPLQLFFRRFPSPLLLKSKIIIHSQFSALVPSAWKDHVLYFGYQPHQLCTALNKKPTKILLYGLVAPASCQLVHWKNLLNWIKNFCEQYQVQDLGVCLIHGQEPLIEALSNSNYYAEFWKLFYSTIPSSYRIQILDWKEVLDRPSFADWSFLDISDKSLLADSFFDHVLLLKGGHPLVDAQGEQPIYDSEPCSMGYSLVVSEKPFLTSTGISEVMDNESAWSGFPWFQWYETQPPIFQNRIFPEIIDSLKMGAIEYQMIHPDVPQCHIDQYSYQDGVLSAHGWALDPYTNLPYQKLVLLSDAQTVFIPTLRTTRRDVIEGLRLSEQSIGCGFSFEIDISSLTDDSLQICLLNSSGTAQILTHVRRNRDKVELVPDASAPIEIQHCSEENETLKLQVNGDTVAYHQRSNSQLHEFSVEQVQGKLSGWVIDKKRPGAAVAVICLSVHCHLAAVCSLRRQDIADIYGDGFTFTGFQFSLLPQDMQNFKIFCVFFDRTYAEIRMFDT
jgi:hypothetical protein